MVMSPVERIMSRRQVNAEILSDPVKIIPHRKQKVDDGAGGWTWSPPVPFNYEVQVLIAPAKRRLSDFHVNSELGPITLYPFILLARHTADLKKNDTFKWNDDLFRIESIYIKTEVSITAQIDYLGGTHNE